MVVGNRGLNEIVGTRRLSEKVVVERMDVEMRVEGRVYYRREGKTRISARNNELATHHMSRSEILRTIHLIPEIELIRSSDRPLFLSDR